MIPQFLRINIPGSTVPEDEFLTVTWSNLLQAIFLISATQTAVKLLKQFFQHVIFFKTSVRIKSSEKKSFRAAKSQNFVDSGSEVILRTAMGEKDIQLTGIWPFGHICKYKDPKRIS